MFTDLVFELCEEPSKDRISFRVVDGHGGLRVVSEAQSKLLLVVVFFPPLDVSTQQQEERKEEKVDVIKTFFILLHPQTQQTSNFDLKHRHQTPTSTSTWLSSRDTDSRWPSTLRSSPASRMVSICAPRWTTRSRCWSSSGRGQSPSSHEPPPQNPPPLTRTSTSRTRQTTLCLSLSLSLYFPFLSSLPGFRLTPIINHQPSTINHQSSTINHQPSIINHQPTFNNHQSSTSDQRSSIINDRRKRRRRRESNELSDFVSDGLEEGGVEKVVELEVRKRRVGRESIVE